MLNAEGVIRGPDHRASVHEDRCGPLGSGAVKARRVVRRRAANSGQGAGSSVAHGCPLLGSGPVPVSQGGSDPPGSVRPPW